MHLKHGDITITGRLGETKIYTTALKLERKTLRQRMDRLGCAPQRRDAGIYDLGQTVRELGPDTSCRPRTNKSAHQNTTNRITMKRILLSLAGGRSA